MRRALLTGEPLANSENDYDWLVTGIYFWEFDPERSLEWAFDIKKRNPRRVRKPAVLGAVINLGHCFDLLDTRYTSILADGYTSYLCTVPEPHLLNTGPLHRQDCDVLNCVIPLLEISQGTRIQTVRGPFQEGPVVFPGSEIRRKSHIQIAVPDSTCILGYFRLSI